MLDCSIASKNVIQCKAIIIPGKENFNKVLKSILILVLLVIKYISVKTLAISILCQTNDIDDTDINSPKIAVNPAIKTRKWR